MPLSAKTTPIGVSSQSDTHLPFFMVGRPAPIRFLSIALSLLQLQVHAFSPFQYKNRNWLGKKDEPMCDGFDWRGGKHPMTQGILIYNEPFLIDFENTKVGIQGAQKTWLLDNGWIHNVYYTCYGDT